jgi:hypothetical protein
MSKKTAKTKNQTMKTTKTMKQTTPKTTKTNKTNCKQKRLASKRPVAQKQTSAKYDKQWFSSKKVRPKTILIVAKRSQDGYRITTASMRVAVNQHDATPVVITDLNSLVNDINQKGIRA